MLLYSQRNPIKRAKQMIRFEMFSIDEVSSAYGVQNVYYFNRIFKKHTGITPEKY